MLGFFFQTFGLELGGHQIVLNLGADGLYMLLGKKKLGLNLELDGHLIGCIKSSKKRSLSYIITWEV
jgi:hypothetical protein